MRLLGGAPSLVFRFFSSLLSMSSWVSIAVVWALKLMMMGMRFFSCWMRSCRLVTMADLPTPLCPMNITLFSRSRQISIRNEYRVLSSVGTNIWKYGRLGS